jgi:hypothetical protein
VRGGVGWGAGEFGGGGVSHHYDWKYCNVSEMLGVVMSNVYKFDYDSNDAIAFEAVDGREWTFYKFASARGYVTVRWYGTSNGYYSESVSFALVQEANA